MFAKLISFKISIFQSLLYVIQNECRGDVIAFCVASIFHTITTILTGRTNDETQSLDL